MASGPLHRCLASARSVITGEFSSASRVVDTLLDLRQLASADSDTAAKIDALLASMAGRTVVTNDWWRASLDSLDEAALVDDPCLAIDA